MSIKNITKRQVAIAFLFSLLFSQAIVIGIHVHFVEIRAGIRENYISCDLTCLLTGVLLSFLLLPVMLLLFELQIKYGLYEGKEEKAKSHSVRFFLISWAILFACWLPYLLTFYPGGLVGDGIEVVRMALNPGFPTSNHWSVLYVLIVKAVIHLGGLVFSNLSDCLFLYAILESVLFSGVCALICSKLRKRFRQLTILPYLMVVVFALSGFFATYSMTFWADGIFGALIALLCMQLWDGLYKTQDSPQMQDTLKLFFTELLICLWRNNGIYIIAFLILEMIILKKRAAIRSAIAGCTVIAITLILTGPVYSKLGVSKDTVRESVSVPLQQIAAAINYGYEPTPDQREILYSVLPEETWKNQYCPTLSDDLKFQINQEYLNQHLGDFLKVWAQMLPANLKAYIKAYLMQTLGFWRLNSFHGLYWDYWYGVQDNYNYGLQEKDLIEEATGKTVRPVLINCMWFLSSGAVVWIMFFSLFSILYQGKGRERILVLLPLIGCWLTVMIATPIAFAYRYVFALALVLPITILLPFCRISPAGESSLITNELF